MSSREREALLRAAIRMRGAQALALPFSSSALSRCSEASASFLGSPPTSVRLATAPRGPSGALNVLE